jgi:hypothetical protein
MIVNALIREGLPRKRIDCQIAQPQLLQAAGKMSVLPSVAEDSGVYSKDLKQDLLAREPVPHT